MQNVYDAKHMQHEQVDKQNGGILALSYVAYTCMALYTQHGLLF